MIPKSVPRISEKIMLHQGQEHDPEKRAAVFGKDHAPPRAQRDGDSKKSHLALGPIPRWRSPWIARLHAKLRHSPASPRPRLWCDPDLQAVVLRSLASGPISLKRNERPHAEPPWW